MHFRYFVIKGGGVFIWTECFVSSLVEIGQVVLVKKTLIFINVYFVYFVIISPCMDKGTALHLNKLESPLPKDALCQVSLKLALWIWRWIFLNFINVYFCNFVIISP